MIINLILHIISIDKTREGIYTIHRPKLYSTGERERQRERERERDRDRQTDRWVDKHADRDIFTRYSVLQCKGLVFVFAL